MNKQIDIENCYYNFYENSQANYKMYCYLRLFKDGQYAYFSSYNDTIDINNLDKANYVGYYIVENNILKLETPTGNINTKSYRVIWEFEIKNGTLKNKKSKLEFEITKKNALTKVSPDW